jgi:hypothetical protein
MSKRATSWLFPQVCRIAHFFQKTGIGILACIRRYRLSFHFILPSFRGGKKLKLKLTCVQECPRWRNNYCKGEESIEELEREISEVAMPGMDPVYGADGALVRIWKGVKV